MALITRSATEAMDDRDPLGRRDGQRAQRVAVEVDHALGQREPGTTEGERIAGVHGLDGRAGDEGHGLSV